METKSKKKLYNAAMVIVIAAIAFCGIMAVGHIKGWLGGESGEANGVFASASDVTGVANVERKGVSYKLESGTELKEKDVLDTASGAEIDFKAGENNFTVAEAGNAALAGIDENKLTIDLGEGEIFATLDKGSQFDKVTLGKWQMKSDNAVFSADKRTGSASVNVFDGTVTVTNDDNSLTAKAGEAINITREDASVAELQAESLSEFDILQATAAMKSRDICFTADELSSIIKEREALAKEAEKTAANTISTDGGASSGNSTSSDASVSKCTISIKCTSILDNLDALSAGKESYVPKNGIILSTSTVEFNEGATAYDILKRVCSAAGIQIEAAYTPAYGSYYVEGINHLYEFDCGDQSGWIYKVNGWSPNYGASQYKVKNGDSIVWGYTCKGMGSDVH